MNKENMSKQHNEIRRAIMELQEDVYDEQEIRKNLLTIALRIGTLSGILLSHLKYEDLVVYPLLIRHEDEKIKDLAENFQLEMGDLAAQFKEYQHKYLTSPESLKSQTGVFIQDTEQILAKIAKRVEKEEYELFTFIQDESVG